MCNVEYVAKGVMPVRQNGGRRNDAGNRLQAAGTQRLNHPLSITGAVEGVSRQRGKLIEIPIKIG